MEGGAPHQQWHTPQGAVPPRDSEYEVIIQRGTLMTHVPTCLSPKKRNGTCDLPERHARSFLVMPPVRGKGEAKEKRHLFLMQSFSHQEKRAKIFSRESWSYLSNSPPPNRRILCDERNGGGWRQSGGDAKGF